MIRVADVASFAIDPPSSSLRMSLGKCACAACQGKEADNAPAPALSSAAVSSANLTTVPIGGSVKGTLVDGEEADLFSVNLVAGTTYLFGLTGSGANPLQDPRTQMFDRNGVIVADNDDAGVGTDALFAFTATYTGIYTVNARGFAGSLGQYTLSAERRGSDDVAGTQAGAARLAIGTSKYDFIESAGDVDTYAVNLVAGTAYLFNASGVDVLARGDPLVISNDIALTLRNAAGEALGGTADGPLSDVTFVAQSSGTYYVSVSSPDAGTGGYQLSTKGYDLKKETPVDSIRATDALPMPKEITVYFAKTGEQIFDETAIGWSQYEIGQAMLAFAQFEKYLDVDVRITTDSSNPTFKLVKANSDFVAYAGSQGDTRVAVFSPTDIPGWDNFKGGGLEQGGFGFSTIGHELAHGFGIAHPFGGGATTMLGTNGDSDQLGLFDLNQGVFTNTSYNDGWITHPDFGNGDGDRPPNSNQRWGANNAVMALDIALMQSTIGANTTYASGNDRYVLPERNATGTFYQAIWDTGGVDTIEHRGSQGAMIDLRAATLRYEEGGGGRVSFAEGIFGGFTIANGVTIENATSRSGADTLIGNQAANRLDAGGGTDLLRGLVGNDTLLGGQGNDWIEGGAGADIMTGGSGSDIFFFNRDLAGGRDRITDFAADDVLVTTVKLRDSNNDGVINVGADGLFPLVQGGSVVLEGSNGVPIRSLRFDGVHVADGVQYFIYDMSGRITPGGFGNRLDDYDLL